MEDDIFLQTLRQYWGYDDFRGVQRRIIDSISEGRDTLGLMPTGGGKSLTFQVPTMAGPGLCLVITPLIALMKDQVENLRNRGIKATAIYSGMSHDEQLKALDNCVLGGYKFLYISPERIGSPLFQAKLRFIDVCLITVDEAHCISQWGYDFRPSYRHVVDIRALLPSAPVLALTATATPRVVDDIQAQLCFSQPNVIRMSFERKNLCYVVRNAENKEGELLHILRSVPGSAIVYTRSRKGTRDIAKLLCSEGITALNYHAGLTNDDKDLRQQSWKKGDTRVMVATNAFGMGVDKADVRLVVHTSAPDSPEAYFQEAGRAGRDGRKAYAVLLYNNSDTAKLRRRVAEAFPDKDYIRQVYEDVAYYLQIGIGEGYERTREFNLEDFCVRFRHFPVQAHSAIQILARAGYWDYQEADDSQSRIVFLLKRDELYRLSLASPECENLIQAVLRNYGGVFADYVFIEETLLARCCGLTPERVYQLLKFLSEQGIIHYIPRKHTPRITYLTRRVEKERIYLSDEVYALRKEECAERVASMIAYATTDRCRSQMLLEYFGETGSEECGQCDVCLSRRRGSLAADSRKIDAAAQAVVNRLRDGGRMPASQLRDAGFSPEVIGDALQRLVDERRVSTRDGLFWLNG